MYTVCNAIPHQPLSDACMWCYASMFWYSKHETAAVPSVHPLVLWGTGYAGTGIVRFLFLSPAWLVSPNVKTKGGPIHTQWRIYNACIYVCRAMVYVLCHQPNVWLCCSSKEKGSQNKPSFCLLQVRMVCLCIYMHACFPFKIRAFSIRPCTSVKFIQKKLCHFGKLVTSLQIAYRRLYK